MDFKLHLLNAMGFLDPYQKDIETSFKKAKSLTQKSLGLKNLDIVVRHLPDYVIPELKVGGFTAQDGHSVYMSVDAVKGFESDEFYSQLLHELHHARRFQDLGWPETLADNLVAEGLACLFEKEICGRAPIYAQVVINEKNISEAKKYLFKKEYEHHKWFFGSEELNLSRWFGYTYGYKLCEAYSSKTHKTASELVGVDSKKIIPR